MTVRVRLWAGVESRAPRWRGFTDDDAYPVLPAVVKEWCAKTLQPGWRTDWDVDDAGGVIHPILICADVGDAVHFRLRWADFVAPVE